MRKYGLLLFIFIAASASGITGPAQSDIIPYPSSVSYMDGNYCIDGKTTIGCEEGLEGYVDYFSGMVRRSSGIVLKNVPVGRADIRFRISADSLIPDEGYELRVGRGGIDIVASGSAGIFYGIQTLLQIMPEEIFSASLCPADSYRLPYVTVSDSPERPWRAMMLDVARYFYNLDFLKKYIDMMAMYKLNVLQLHLIDDSGWRMEIKGYPELTSVGAWAGPETSRLGGYYTQDELRELVAYAAFRNVEIIPELEFPAHILSAVVAYPWLSCTGVQHQMPEQHFISRDLICAGKESSYEFLENVLDEIVSVFPSEYVNIGGDEAVYDRWKKCPYCLHLRDSLGLEDVSMLQGYMTDRVSDMLAERGKKAVGWEEIALRGKLRNTVTALVWHDVADTLRISRMGHKAVLTPASHMYFDFPESGTPGEVKSATWMPPISLEKCYSMPVNDYSGESSVIGVQGCFWTDQFIHGTMLQEITPIDENRSERYAEYLTFPRLMALSEVAWKRESDRDWESFRRRLKSHFPRLDLLDCGYRVPEPEIVSMDTTEDGKVEFVLEPSVEGSVIRYTTDGTWPNVHSPIYEGPVRTGTRDDFRAITVTGSGKCSLPIYFEPDYSSYAEYGTFVASWSPSVISRNSSVWKTDCSGKFRGNGTYVVTLVYTGGEGSVSFRGADMLKRDQKMASDRSSCTVDRNTPVHSFELVLDGYEAGTPFFLSFPVSGNAGPYNEGLVFIRRK